MKDLSIVIVFQHNPKDLCRLNNVRFLIKYYNSLKKDIDCELVVLENNGLFLEIENVDVYRSFNFDNMYFNKCQLLNKSLGLCNSNNLLFVDADIMITQNNIENGLNVIRNGGVYHPIERNIKLIHEQLTTELIKGGLDIDFNYLERNSEQASTAFLVKGGCLMMSVDSFKSVGGFNENFIGWGCEDLEFYLRFEAFDIDVSRGVEPVFHLHHKNFRDIENYQIFTKSNDNVYYQIEGLSKDLRKEYFSNVGLNDVGRVSISNRLSIKNIIEYFNLRIDVTGKEFYYYDRFLEYLDGDDRNIFGVNGVDVSCFNPYHIVWNKELGRNTFLKETKRFNMTVENKDVLRDKFSLVFVFKMNLNKFKIKNLEYSLEYYSRFKDDLDFEIVLVEEGSDLFSKNKCVDSYINVDSNDCFYHKSKLINIGVNASKNENVLIVDEDFLISKDSIIEGLDAVDSQTAFYPFDGEVCNIGRKSSHKIIQDGSYDLSKEELSSIGKLKFQDFGFCGSIFITKTLHLFVGGFNENFIGFDKEKDEFALRLKTFNIFVRNSKDKAFILYSDTNDDCSFNVLPQINSIILNSINSFSEKDKMIYFSSVGDNDGDIPLSHPIVIKQLFREFGVDEEISDNDIDPMYIEHFSKFIAGVDGVSFLEGKLDLTKFNPYHIIPNCVHQCYTFLKDTPRYRQQKANS